MIIFLSGPIRSDPNYFEHFAQVEERIGTMTAGKHEIINPARFMYPEEVKAGWHEKQIMEVCKAYLNMADAIYLLRGWENSDGSKEELQHFLSRESSFYFDGEKVVEYKIFTEGWNEPWMIQ